jgi:hypothetical protein
VLHDGPFRQRVQRIFLGTPVEIFVNPEPAVVRYFEEEAREGRPVTAHMLATGVPLVGANDPQYVALCRTAQGHLDTAPSWSDGELTQARYGAATLVEDALDRRFHDPHTALRILANAMDATLAYWFKQRGRYIPHSKQILPELESLDASLAALFRSFWSEDPIDRRWAAALEVADRVLDARGFFEWESDRQAC